MATAASVLVATESTTVSPHTTAAFTPTALSEVFVVVSVTGGTGLTGALLASAISSTHTNLGPWSIEQVSAPGVSGATALYVFHAFADTGVGSGTVTVTLGGTTPPDAQVTVLQVTDARSYDVVRGAVSGAGAVDQFSLSLGEAPLGGDMVLAFSTSRNDGDGCIPGSGFTELYDNWHANPSASQAGQYRTGSASTAVGVTGLDTAHSSFLALIVKQEDGGTPPAEVWEAFVWDGTTLLPADVFVTPDGLTLEAAEVLAPAE